MEFFFKKILFLIFCFTCNLLLFIGSATSGETEIKSVPKFPILSVGRRVHITCQSASNVAGVFALSLEMSLAGDENFENLITADDQDLRWNLSKSQDIRSRSELRGNVTNTGRWIKLTLMKLKCSDSANYRCVTSGRLRRSTSKIIEMQVIGSPKDLLISQTVPLGTIHSVDRVIYKAGTVVKLTCSAKLGYPFTLSTFHWYKVTTNQTKVEIVSTPATKYGDGPTSGACLFSRGFSNITYHPEITEVETLMLCEVRFQNPSFPNQRDIINTSVLLNVHVEPSKATTQGHSTDSLIFAIAGSITAVLVVGVLILIIMRAYGYRFTVNTEDAKKNLRSSKWSPPPVSLYQCGLNAGLPEQLSIYEVIDQPSYEESNSRLDSHGYLDLNGHHEL